MKHRWITTLFCLASLGSIAAQSEQGESAVVLKVNDLYVANYTPQNSSSSSLYRLASSMVGREFFVAERGGAHFSDAVENMALLGNQVILYDTKEYVDRMLAALKKLDVMLAPSDLTKRREAQMSRDSYSVSHYIPRYISLESALNAIDAFFPTRQGARTVSERNTLILRDTAARLVEMEKLLVAIDVPEDQVILTCYLLQGRKGGEDSGTAPAELVRNLKTILPGMSFETVGFALLQSTVVPGRKVSLILDGNDGKRFELSFSPVAFDRQTSSITARSVKVIAQGAIPFGAGGPVAQTILSTDTIFRGNQFTVLGATGQDPSLFVVHITPLKPN